jgi:hypothetical protein
VARETVPSRKHFACFYEGRRIEMETIRTIAIAAVCAAAYVAYPAAAAAQGKIADHTLMDETSGDTFAQCRTTNGPPFDFHVAARALGGEVVMRVEFLDGDFIDYSIPAEHSFSLDMAAGTSTSDDRLKVSKSGGSGFLVAWLSASRLPGTSSLVLCRTE